MRKHDLSVISALKADRANGYSIGTLIEKYKLPKTTIWHHVHTVVIPESLKQTLRSRQGGSKMRSETEWKRAEQIAKSLCSNIRKEEIWPIVIASLYWSEGTKKSGFVFTNTDPAMVKVFLQILREYLHIQNNELHILIRTAFPMMPEVCKDYWSDVTGIPAENIHINHDNKQNRGKTQYGMCRITLRKGSARLKLMHCLIRELTAKMLQQPS